jgi:hypothetical protein
VGIRAIENSAILFSEMTPGDAWEYEFNDWYDHEHIPLRMNIPGFTSAQRYRSTDTRNYSVVYEMNSPAVLSTEAYGRVKNHPSERTARMLRDVSGFTRYICEQINTVGGDEIDAPVLYAVFFAVPEDRQSEFNSWYDQDHVPALMKCPDWRMVRRFRVLGGEPKEWTHLALHYLRNRDALNSGARETARRSDWRAGLATESWFKPHYLIFDRLGPRQKPPGR